MSYKSQNPCATSDPRAYKQEYKQEYKKIEPLGSFWGLSALFFSFFRIKSETLTAVNNLLFAVVRVHQTSIASAIAFKLSICMGKCEKSLRMRFRAFYGLLNLYEVNHIMKKGRG